MKALILAAGYGKRLLPITNEMPKSMIEINGTPLLINALNILSEVGINDVGIVVGHKSDYIKNKIGNNWKSIRITYYENSRYMETNNVFSLYKASEFCSDDMILLECDLFYKADVIKNLLSSQGECSILVSPFNKKTMNGTVIKCIKDKPISLVLGKWQDKDFDYTDCYKTVNMYKFTASFARKFISLVEWYVNNMGENSYYEKVLGSMMFLKENDFRIVKIPENLWCEIDEEKDIEIAREKVNIILP